MANIDVDSDELNVRAMTDGEVVLQVTWAKRMLVASVIASMSIVAVAALFMSLWV
ncbi:MAG TPA: hypothetical protein VGD86_11135 [Devosia sp.]